MGILNTILFKAYRFILLHNDKYDDKSYTYGNYTIDIDIRKHNRKESKITIYHHPNYYAKETECAMYNPNYIYEDNVRYGYRPSKESAESIITVMYQAVNYEKELEKRKKQSEII